MSDWSIEHADGVAIATFTRPPRNFMSFAAMEELERLLTELADRDDVSVVVLTGGLDRYFVAHADLDELARLGRGEPVNGDPGAWARALALIETVPQPVVAAINGQAWGGGCEISLACTLRVAAESAHLAQPEIAVGIIPGAGGTQRLPRLVGPGRAAELILSGRVVDATEALSIGLVEAVLADDGFREAAVEYARRFAQHPRYALAAAKRAVHEGLQHPLDEGLRIEGRLFVECQANPAAVELEERALDRYATAGPEETVHLTPDSPGA